MAFHEQGASENAPVVLRIKLRYDTVHTFVDHFASYINQVGIFLRSPSPKPVGTWLGIELYLADRTLVFDCEGVVRWVRPVDPDNPGQEHGMGIEFTGLSPESRAILERIMDERVRRGIPALRTIPHAPEDAAGPASVVMRSVAELIAQAASEAASGVGDLDLTELLSGDTSLLEPARMQRAMARARELSRAPGSDDLEALLVRAEVPAGPAARAPVAATKPAASGPVVAAKPAASGPVIAAKPAAKVPVIAAKPAAKVPVIAAKPEAKVPVIAAKPEAKVPVVAAKPAASGPVAATKPAATKPAAMEPGSKRELELLIDAELSTLESDARAGGSAAEDDGIGAAVDAALGGIMAESEGSAAEVAEAAPGSSEAELDEVLELDDIEMDVAVDIEPDDIEPASDADDLDAALDSAGLRPVPSEPAISIEYGDAESGARGPAAAEASERMVEIPAEASLPIAPEPALADGIPHAPHARYDFSAEIEIEPLPPVRAEAPGDELAALDVGAPDLSSFERVLSEDDAVLALAGLGEDMPRTIAPADRHMGEGESTFVLDPSDIPELSSLEEDEDPGVDGGSAARGTRQDYPAGASSDAGVGEQTRELGPHDLLQVEPSAPPVGPPALPVGASVRAASQPDPFSSAEPIELDPSEFDEDGEDSAFAPIPARASAPTIPPIPRGDDDDDSSDSDDKSSPKKRGFFSRIFNK